MTSSPSLLAAVRYRRGDGIDLMLEAFIRALQARGVAVAGYVQRESDVGEDCCPTTHLEDVATGERWVISQPLGAGARGCRLDPQALAAVCGPLQARLGEGGVDLLVLNRFGKGESQGHGFRAAIERAMLAHVPVLTAVQDAYLDAWQDFAGDFGTVLPAARDAVEDWAGAVLAGEGRAS